MYRHDYAKNGISSGPELVLLALLVFTSKNVSSLTPLPSASRQPGTGSELFLRTSTPESSSHKVNLDSVQTET